MRIAFVGKGGVGKTTFSALFSKLIISKRKPILVIDADINVHLPELFDCVVFPEEYISNNNIKSKIKDYLKGTNHLIKNNDEFRKTTPPSVNSKLITITKEDYFISNFCKRIAEDSYLAIVGTYDIKGIGTSCYHNNLEIVEIILSHTYDKDEFIVSDMVAGTDLFASSMHLQFDVIVLIVEPTKKSLEIYKLFESLSKDNIDHLFVVGNKIKTEEDIDFLKINIDANKIIGFIRDSKYLQQLDKYGGEIVLENFEIENLKVLEKLYLEITKIVPDPNKRLSRLQMLHTRYVSQPNIKSRFGDLSSQIDPNFKFK